MRAHPDTRYGHRAATEATAPSRRETNSRATVAAAAMAAWLLGKDQSPGAGHASSVITRRLRQGRSSRTSSFSTASTPKATTTTKGTASAVRDAVAPSRLARHQPTVMSTANRASPYVDHADTVSSSHAGACRARFTTSV